MAAILFLSVIGLAVTLWGWVAGYIFAPFALVAGLIFFGCILAVFKGVSK